MLVFIYGSLKKNECNHGLLMGQRFAGVAETFPKYRMYDCGHFPALIPAEDGLSIWGELYDVDNGTILYLDHFEGVSQGLYRRGWVEIQRPLTLAYGYFWARSIADLEDCGQHWKSNSGKKK